MGLMIERLFDKFDMMHSKGFIINKVKDEETIRTFKMKYKSPLPFFTHLYRNHYQTNAKYDV